MTAAATLAQFMHFDLVSSQAEWRQIEARSDPVPGRRQVDFVPLEVLLCHAASHLVNHRQFGSSTAHTAGPPVPQLAALFRRPPSSILAKMANLDGSRPNAGKWDRAAATAWNADPSRFEASYAIVLLAGRRAGITSDRLPDVLA